MYPTLTPAAGPTAMQAAAADVGLTILFIALAVGVVVLLGDRFAGGPVDDAPAAPPAPAPEPEPEPETTAPAATDGHHLCPHHLADQAGGMDDGRAVVRITASADRGRVGVLDMYGPDGTRVGHIEPATGEGEPAVVVTLRCGDVDRTEAFGRGGVSSLASLITRDIGRPRTAPGTVTPLVLCSTLPDAPTLLCLDDDTAEEMLYALDGWLRHLEQLDRTPAPASADVDEDIQGGADCD